MCRLSMTPMTQFSTKVKLFSYSVFMTHFYYDYLYLPICHFTYTYDYDDFRLF